MHAQMAARLERLAPLRACDVVFVSRGDGNRALAESLGARVIVDRGARGDDPSTAELVAAIERANAGGVIVLPNDASALLAARQRGRARNAPGPRAREQDDRRGRLRARRATCPRPGSTRTSPTMAAVLADVRSGRGRARRAGASIDGVEVQAGDSIAFAEGRAIASLPDADAALLRAAGALLAAGERS